MGKKGRSNKRYAPCELEERKARSKRLQERRQPAKPIKPIKPDPFCCDCGKQLQIGSGGQRPKRCDPCRGQITVRELRDVSMKSSKPPR